jgi:hypothetical protein
MNDIEKAIEDLKDINTILKTQHMCKVLDDELTKKDVGDYKSRFASVNLAISVLEKQLNECCHCNEEIKGIKKVKVWNGKLLPMCYSCWSKWINGGR